MYRRRFSMMSLFCIGLAGCATSSGKSVTPKTVAAEVPESTETEDLGEKAQESEERSVRIDLKMPSVDWIRVSESGIDGKESFTFLNTKLLAKVDIFIQYQEGTDAHKLAQYMALVLVTSGGEPIRLYGDPDSAWLGYRGGNTEVGVMYGITDIRRSDFDPDLYVLVVGVWPEMSHDKVMLDEFSAITNSVKLTRQ